MFLAVDIGGTTIKFAVIDKNKNIIERRVEPTPDNVNKKITAVIVEVAKALKKDFDYQKIGISSAGVIDVINKKVISAGPTITAYVGTDFKKEIEDVLDVELFIDNDVNCALLGEMKNGAGVGLSEVFCVALGTGIGGAYYGNTMLTGSNFGLGEIGQTLFDGKTTFEQRASTIALASSIKEKIDSNLSVIDFFEACKKEDKKCLALLDEWLVELAKGLVNMMLIIDPKYIILGGAISKQGDYIINLIDNKVRALHPIKTNKTKFLVAKLDNDAALFGAISIFLDK